MYDESWSENEENFDEDPDLDIEETEEEFEEDPDPDLDIVEIVETDKLNEDNGQPLLPKYGYYQVQKKPAPPEKQKKESGFGKKLLTTVALAVVFGAVAGLVMTGVYRITAPYPVEEKTSAGSNSAAKSVAISRTPGEEAVSEADSSDVSGGIPEQAESNPPETGKAVEAIPAKEAAAEKETVSDMEGSGSLSASTGKGAVADAAAACMPSVVAITSVSIQEIPSFFGYGRQTYESESSGSGIIVGENDEELLIATNNHVVADASTLSVLFIGDDGAASGEELSGMESIANDLNYEGAVNALVKGTDPENDLAVVAVNKEDIPSATMERIKIATLGNSDDLVVGEQVVAIGNALGYGQSVTSGWISALNRSITSGDGTVSGLIQTDAAINPGNSGGALLNMKGEVIGINSAKYARSSVEGMGYAIPVSKASPILNDLMTRETRVKLDSSEAAYMGVSVADLSLEAYWMYGIPEGAFISQAYEGGAADQAGIRRGDIIIMMDGHEVYDKEDLIDMLSYYRPGEEVEVVLYRKGMDGLYEKMTVYVTMGSRQ